MVLRWLEEVLEEDLLDTDRQKSKPELKRCLLEFVDLEDAKKFSTITLFTAIPLIKANHKQ